MIPTNFTLEEKIKYGNLPFEVQILFDEIFEENRNLKDQIRELSKINEIIEEQIYFRNDFIIGVLDYCKNTTRHKELVNRIKTQLENSFFEL